MGQVCDMETSWDECDLVPPWARRSSVLVPMQASHGVTLVSTVYFSFLAGTQTDHWLTTPVCSLPNATFNIIRFFPPCFPRTHPYPDFYLDPYQNRPLDCDLFILAVLSKPPNSFNRQIITLADETGYNPSAVCTQSYPATSPEQHLKMLRHPH